MTTSCHDRGAASFSADPLEGSTSPLICSATGQRAGVDEILGAFDSKAREFSDLAPHLEQLLSQLLGDRGIRVHSVDAGVKERLSLARKVEAHEPAYPSLRDVTDVLRARIVTYFPDEIDRVGELIEDEFTVDRANSRDPRATIEPDKFGYQSLHFVVTLSPARTALREWTRLAGWPFEIQVRTILQLAWAEIEHDRGFHTRSDVPADVRRRWSRVAALLELADSEFAALRDIASKAPVDGQERLIAPSPKEVPSAFSSVAVTSVGNLRTGLTASGLVISIVLAEPGTMKRTLAVALETPDVTFQGTPIVSSNMKALARIESGGRVIAVDLVPGTAERSLVILGLGLAAGQAAPPGPVQTSIAVDSGNRRLLPTLGVVSTGTDIVVVVRNPPTLRMGGRNQITGHISIVEVAAGSLMDTGVLRLRLVDMSDVDTPGGTFETAPLLVVSHGDLRLREGGAASPTNVVRGTVGANDASCAEWSIWTRSTVPSTLEVSDAGRLTGPSIAVGVSRGAVGLQVETIDGQGIVHVRSLTVLGFPVAGE